MFKKSMLAATVLAAIVTTAHAQPTDVAVPLPADSGAMYGKGTIGFALPFALLNNVGTVRPAATPTVNVMYFLSDKAALEAIIGIAFRRFEDNSVPAMPVTSNVFGIAVGAGYRMYTHKGKLHSYLEPYAVLDLADTANAGNSMALRLGAQLGAERELTDWLTLSGALGAVAAFENKFKNIAVLPTASLAANFYWK